MRIRNPARIKRGETGFITQRRQHRSLAFTVFQPMPQRPRKQQDVAEQDRRIEGEATNRL